MTEIFARLIQEKITPNTYYVLHCIKEKIVPFKFVSKDLEISRLISDNWLDENLQLTSKSLIFIEELNGYFKKTKKKASIDLMGTAFVQNIEGYVEIFPNKKLSSGKYARVNPKNLEAPFRWFFETYDYDWVTIFAATEKYVSEYEVKRYEFMRTAQYFLRKQNLDKSYESDLATYCEIVRDNPDGEVVYFKERVV
jgi:hypothetical protein